MGDSKQTRRQSVATAFTPQSAAEIDRLVYELYDLIADKIRLMEQSAAA